MTDKSPITPKSPGEDNSLDLTLRPGKLADYIGQTGVKDNLKILIQAAKGRQEPIEHVLIYGPPGIGKTTLANIIARECEANIQTTSGPAIERVGDLASILTNLQEGDVLFIDEIHRLNRAVEEVMYPAMEDHALDIIIGKGPGAKSVRLDLPAFTIIGATTRAGLLSSPLRDRFGASYKLDFYEDVEMREIVKRSASIFDLIIDDPAIAEISCRSRRTPRVANRLLKRVRDYAQVKADGNIDLRLAKEALKQLEIDAAGLDPVDRKILSLIADKFAGGPVGVNTIASSLSEEPETIEEVYEPYLIQEGFLARTARGRIITDKGKKHLGILDQKSTTPSLF